MKKVRIIFILLLSRAHKYYYNLYMNIMHSLYKHLTGVKICL